jgi:hypothetical protein
MRYPLHMSTREVLPVGRVFVPGGLPTVTYVAREALNLEGHVRDYLNELHRVLSLSGPTKSGKTVLLRSILGSHASVWLSGGQITSLTEFWAVLADALEIPLETGMATQSAASTSGQTAFGGGIAPGGIGVKADKSLSESTTTGTTGTTKWVRSSSNAVREELRRRLIPLVIDDFHYINADVQLQIVRNLKDLVFDGLPVVLASVPHRAYDAVRVEREMTGRVEQLPIEFWSTDELLEIAAEGFAALKVRDDADLAQRLAEESFSSPHLMQDFCLNLCKLNGITQTCETETELAPPASWDDFFRGRASMASKTAFDLLARGPRQRSDRIERTLRGGTTTDIYGAVLVAIAATGPLTQITYEELRASLREVLASDPPQRHEVARVLEEMAKIAREQIEGEPVVDYDASMATLFISDPFFAYYLRWAVRPDPARPAVAPPPFISM